MAAAVTAVLAAVAAGLSCEQAPSCISPLIIASSSTDFVVVVIDEVPLFFGFDIQYYPKHRHAM
jgi:hypothetical protein